MLECKNKYLLHVVPENDIRLHELTSSCWCHPDTNENGVVVHNAADEREHYGITRRYN